LIEHVEFVADATNNEEPDEVPAGGSESGEDEVIVVDNDKLTVR
jgi:hypothetical protein